MNEAPAAVYFYDTSIQCSFILCCVQARSICSFEHIVRLKGGEGMRKWERTLGQNGVDRNGGNNWGASEESSLLTLLYFLPLEFCTHCNCLDKQRSVWEKLDQHLHKFSLSSVRCKMRAKRNIVQGCLNVVPRLVASTAWKVVSNANFQVPPQAYPFWNLRVEPSNLFSQAIEMTGIQVPIGEVPLFKMRMRNFKEIVYRAKFESFDWESLACWFGMLGNIVWT